MNEEKKGIINALCGTLASVIETYNFDREDVIQLFYSVTLEICSAYDDPEEMYKDLIKDMEALGGSNIFHSISELDKILGIDTD